MNLNEPNPHVPQEDWLADLLAPGAAAAKDVNPTALAPAPTEAARLAAVLEPEPTMSAAFPSLLLSCDNEADRPAPASAPPAVSNAAATAAERLAAAESGAVSARIKRRLVVPFLLGAAVALAGETGIRQLWNPNFLRFGAVSEVAKVDPPPAEPSLAAATSVAANAHTAAVPGVAVNSPASSIPAGPAGPAANATPETNPAGPTATAAAPSHAGPPGSATQTGAAAASYPTVEDLLVYFQKPASSLPPPQPSP